jgi:hypothetical protein
MGSVMGLTRASFHVMQPKRPSLKADTRSRAWKRPEPRSALRRHRTITAVHRRDKSKTRRLPRPDVQGRPRLGLGAMSDICGERRFGRGCERVASPARDDRNGRSAGAVVEGRPALAKRDERKLTR